MTSASSCSGPPHHDHRWRLDHSQHRQHGRLKGDYGICDHSFLLVFLLIASGGLLLFYREAMLQRISEVINPQAKPKTLLEHHSGRASRSAAWSSTSTM
jgi:hypothetical protein